VRVIARIDTVDGETGAYLATVARNLCYREFGRRARHRSCEEADLHACRSAPLEGAESAVLKRVWSQLSPTNRSVIAHSFAGYSYEETARRTGLSVSAVTSQVWRARQRARQLAGVTATTLVALAAGIRRLATRSVGRLHTTVRYRAGTDATLPVLTATMQSVALAVPLFAGALTAGGTPPRQPQRPWAGAGPVVLLADSTIPRAAVGADAGRLPRLVAQPALHASPSTMASPRRVPAHNGVAGGLSTPDQATQEDARAESITPVPNAPATAFVSGMLASNCGASCPALFRTDDGGQTWQNVIALRFPGGTVLPAPSFPRDPRLFAVTSTALWESDDAGATFALVAPIGGAAAMDPSSTVSDLRVVIAAAQPVIYHTATHAITPGPSLPPGVGGASAVAFTPDGHLLIASATVASTISSAQDSLLFRCPLDGSCTSVLEINDAPVWLAQSPEGVGMAVAAWSPSHLDLSLDGGLRFAEIQAPIAGGNLAAVAVDAGSSCPSVCVFAASSAGPVALNALSTDAGQTFAPVAERSPLISSAFLGDAHLVSGLGTLDIGGLGVRCSPDLGRTWASSC